VYFLKQELYQPITSPVPGKPESLFILKRHIFDLDVSFVKEKSIGLISIFMIRLAITVNCEFVFHKCINIVKK